MSFGRGGRFYGVSMRAESIVQVNGVPLCIETFGERSDPAVLLIMGSSASMDWWETELCERIAAGGRFVVRYDHRDTGRSVSYEPGSPPYSLRDLADDAAALSEVLGLARVHLVGMSLGGAIAQAIALERPDRVLTLTLIACGPAGPGDGNDRLPGMSPETIAAFTSVGEPDWEDREGVARYVADLVEIEAADSVPFDAAAIEHLVQCVFDRTIDFKAGYVNHSQIEFDLGLTRPLGELEAPALVIHGTEDPIVPFANALALRDRIPGAELLTLEQTGHELPRRTWDVLAEALISHTANA
jgi:pimeloyl-ACP methyl ester carboxylesterase